MHSPDSTIPSGIPLQDLEGLRMQLHEAILQVMEWDYSGTPHNYLYLHELLGKALPMVEGLDLDEDFIDAISTLLMSAERFRASAQWKSRNPPSEERTTFLYSCDIASDYPMSYFTWENRRQAFWKYFSGIEFGLARSLVDPQHQDIMLDFRQRLDVVFPISEISLFPAAADQKNTFLTGLPDGILTLPAMQYLCRRHPAGIGKRWDIAISGAGLSESKLQGIRVSLTEQDGKICLSVWHPQLSKTAEDAGLDPRAIAVRAVNEVLPMGARLLYVSDITAADDEPASSFPISELPQQMRDRGFQIDIPLDALLSRRKYTIRRQPKDTGRPRDDIVQGETCMPELERIHRHLYDEGQEILERYGLYAAFLMIPKSLCGDDPAQYRQQLQSYLAQAEGDKFFFTGWAEGTKYCYLDFLSMDGQSLLDTLHGYAHSKPGGAWLRLCAFFWRSVPRSLDKVTANEQMRSEEHADFAEFARKHTVPDFPAPDAATAAAFEASFHPEFTPEDLCAPAPVEAQGGNQKLSKAQRRAQRGKNGKGKK